MDFNVCLTTDDAGLLFNGVKLPWWDQNYDALFTISDVWLIAGRLFHLPGDYLFRGIIANAPGLATFLELDCSAIGDVASGLISFIAWFFFFIFWGIIMIMLADHS